MFDLMYVLSMRILLQTIQTLNIYPQFIFKNQFLRKHIQQNVWYILLLFATSQNNFSVVKKKIIQSILLRKLNFIIKQHNSRHAQKPFSGFNSLSNTDIKQKKKLKGKSYLLFCTRNFLEPTNHFPIQCIRIYASDETFFTKTKLQFSSKFHPLYTLKNGEVAYRIRIQYFFFFRISKFIFYMFFRQSFLILYILVKKTSVD